MVCVTLDYLIVRLFSWQVIFTHKPQFFQQFQRPVDRRETDIGIAFLHPLSYLIHAEMPISFLNYTENHITLGSQTITPLAQCFIAGFNVMMHNATLACEWYVLSMYPSTAIAA